jgi:serralysin
MTKIILAAIFICGISEQAAAQKNGCSTIERSATINFHKNSSDTTKSRGLADNYYLWDPGTTIKVKFLSGSKTLQNKIIPFAKEWEKYANIKFEFVTGGQADIRVKIGTGDGHNSYIGTVARFIDAGSETMNLDSVDFASDESFLKLVVLHEFGHAIGLLHEHSSPVSGIKWDKQKMYKEYAKMGWSKEDVDYQVFTSYKTSYTNGTKYDNKSIMHYPIKEGETTNGYVIDWNKTLSKGDIELIAALYPKKGKRKMEVTRINIQNFNGIKLEGNDTKMGISLFPAFDLRTGSKSGKVKMIFKFYDEQGYGFGDEDGTYEENGTVATMRTVLLPANKTIRYNQDNKKDFEFFLPVDQIPYEALNQNMIVTFKIVFETGEGELKNLFQSQPLQFKYPKLK